MSSVWLLAAVPYSPARAHDLAMVVAGIVPVLLVAAFAMPARRATTAEEAPRVLGDLMFGAALLGLALVTEMLALFGVAYGLGHRDQQLLFVILFFTAVASFRRMVAPLVWAYAEDRQKPATRFWWLLGGVAFIVSLGMTVFLSLAE